METKQLEQIVAKEDKQASKPAQSGKKESIYSTLVQYWQGCTDPKNARLYGTFQERAALNITQFVKIQGSLLIRMGMVYPIISYALERMGLPKDAATQIGNFGINYHTWAAGYLAYLVEIQAGLSKYAIEGAGWAGRKAAAAVSTAYDYFDGNTPRPTGC